MRREKIRNPKDFKIIRWLFSFWVEREMCDSIMEDMENRFSMNYKQRGAIRAWFILLRSSLVVLASMMFMDLTGEMIMVRNYVVTVLRNIRRHKTFSLINIAGLATAIACAILVLLYVNHESSYDRFHEKKDQIYRLTTEKSVRNTWYFSPMAPWSSGQTLKARFPEVEDFTIYSSSLTYCFIEKNGEKFRTREERIVSQSFFDIFSFPFLYGDPETALDDPDAIVVTESFANTWFGTTNALGLILNVRGEGRIVTGVLNDIPANSHIQFGFLVPVEWHLRNRAWWNDMLDNNWAGYGVTTYLLMKQDLSVDGFNEKIRNIVEEYDSEQKKRLSVQPLDRVYLYSNMLMEEHEAEESSDQIVGNIHNLRAVAIAAAVLLLIACINFMNLSTAIVGRRAKEIGVRKVCGSQRKDLVRQFLSESLCLTILSSIIALLLVALFLPVFNQYSGKLLSLKALFVPTNILGILGIVLFTGILSGWYPAFYLSSLKSIDVFKKSTIMKPRKSISFRQLLVIFQFTMAITVIICTSVFARQFNFIRSKFDSFNLDNTIVVIDWTFARHHDAVKPQLMQHPHIVSVTQSAMPGAAVSPSTDIVWPGKDPADEIHFFHARVDYEYQDVMKPQVLEGRFFSRDIASDTSHFLVNETAVRVMGMTTPVGNRITYKGKTGMILGVVKDRHFASLRYPIGPFVFEINPDYPRFNIKVDQAENIPTALKHINNVRAKYANYRPVSYWFAEDQLSHYMKEEQTLSIIFSYVTLLTIFIASLGLVGLSLFQAAQKTKEIGIRKVLGGSVAGILSMLTGQFLRWVVLANVIAWPVSWMLMRQWLQNYLYRIPLDLSIFILSGLAAIVVAILTVGFQALKAARANPVDSLRYE